MTDQRFAPNRPRARSSPVPVEELPQPVRMPLPRVTQPFPVQHADIERKIREQVEAHYALVTENEQLRTDRDHYRVRAEVAETEIENLRAQLRARDDRNAELEKIVTELKTQFDAGATIWLNAYKSLEQIPNVTLAAPPDIKALQPPPAHDDDQDQPNR